MQTALPFKVLFSGEKLIKNTGFWKVKGDKKLLHQANEPFLRIWWRNLKQIDTSRQEEQKNLEMMADEKLNLWRSYFFGHVLII